MIHILYVPKDKDPIEFYSAAQENNCQQIIHGPSEIINEYVTDFDSACVVSIPENVYLMISDKVVEENTSVHFKFINEFISDMKKEEPVYLEVCKMYEKNEEAEKIEMKYDGFFSYDADYNFDLYGEYLIRVTGINKHENRINFCEEEIIVYKPSPKEVFSFDD